jgi:hypothetical protein
MIPKTARQLFMLSLAEAEETRAAFPLATSFFHLLLDTLTPPHSLYSHAYYTLSSCDPKRRCHVVHSRTVPEIA